MGICSEGEVNVELFAEWADSQNVTVCSRLSNNSVLSIPLHQRYQAARTDVSVVDVTLNHPKLLFGCDQRILEYRVSMIDLCAPCVDLSFKWREVPYVMVNYPAS